MNNILKDYAGIIHVHSWYSDGSGTVREIINAGLEANISFLIITDHNTLRAQEDNADRWHWVEKKHQKIDSGLKVNQNTYYTSTQYNYPELIGNNALIVMVGEEITRRDGHCLALNIQKNGLSKTKPDYYIPYINQSGGLTFICHPFFNSRLQFGIRDASWKSWDLFNSSDLKEKSIWPVGIEIWSYLGDWAKNLNWSNLISHINEPDKYINGPDKQTLQTWDRLTQIRPLVGFGGVDAHATKPFPFSKYTILPYLKTFLSLRTHILSEPFSGDWQSDSEKIYRALSRGCCYVAYELHRRVEQFTFTVWDDKNQYIGMMGEQIQFKYGICIKANITPGNIQYRLICNGKEILNSDAVELNYPVQEPGVYRLEIYYQNRPWVFSNPIYII